MRLVVLDGFTVNPGDLDWRPLYDFGHCQIFDRTSPSNTVSHAENAQILLTNKVVLDERTIRSLPALRYIGVLATGYNVIDVRAAAARSIIVSNVPGYAEASVSQATMALLLELTSAVGAHDRSVHTGRWAKCKDYSYSLRPLTELSGLTIGIVGFGSIGQSVAKLAEAFGMKVLIHTRSPKKAPKSWSDRCCTLDDLLRRSDVVSLHCPLTPQTEGMIDRKALSIMKPTALLINTARGPLIDEMALAEALNSDTIAGAALDVLSVEPPPADNPLLSAKNCVITPHIAWATHSARARLIEAAVENVKAFLNGSPQNVVKP